MPRLMSVAYTEAQVLDRTKHVTRRLGWRHARPGQRVVLCRKVMGRKPNEPLVRLVVVEFKDVRRESLWPLCQLDDEGQHSEWARDEMAREGFPGMDPTAFVLQFFVKAQRTKPTAEVTRIEWRYCSLACLLCGREVHGDWLLSPEFSASHYCITCLNGPVPA